MSAAKIPTYAQIIRTVLKRPGWEVDHARGVHTPDIRYRGIYGTGHIHRYDHGPLEGRVWMSHDGSPALPEGKPTFNAETLARQLERIAGQPVVSHSRRRWIRWVGPDGDHGGWVTDREEINEQVYAS